MSRFLTFLGLSICTIASGQFPYSAVVLEEEYAPLANPVSLGIDVGWDDPEVEIPIPFDFVIGEGGDVLSSILLSGTGEMLMGMSTDGTLDILWPISLDVMDIGAVEMNEASFIQYEVTGDSPNRILKIEWDEVGLYEEISDFETTTLRLNFQAWLYENGNIIEYRFGPNTLGDSSMEMDLLTSGIMLDFDYDYYNGLFYTASGDPSEPEWSLTDDFYAWYYGKSMLDGVPPNGTVYRFGPATNIAETHSNFSEGLNLYPNPAGGLSGGQCWMENPHNHPLLVTIMDAQGRAVSETKLLQDQRRALNVSNWKPGFYLVQALHQNGNVHLQRLMVE